MYLLPLCLPFHVPQLHQHVLSQTPTPAIPLREEAQMQGEGELFESLTLHSGVPQVKTAPALAAFAKLPHAPVALLREARVEGLARLPAFVGLHPGLEHQRPDLEAEQMEA